ncbi:PAS domain S-box protein [Acidiferrimicrobium sp. IK]|uniref:sensor domain-containing protein n=1 Tax=Acidiferrimicrobium sp. IK TaxID=2871700 RepID=UPI0021CB1C82|nr:PAS domain S-box protein [Acidiferrimicrobium sp. IK]MCU4183789.1 PAS domain S-box protein [Acidiferrimicrobium sp. IK]
MSQTPSQGPRPSEDGSESVAGRQLDLQRLAAIVTWSNDAILSKTVDGIITSWNASAERLYGYSPEEVLGRHVRILVPDGRLDELAVMLERVAAGEAIERLETLRRRKDGSEVWVSLSVLPLFAEDGTVQGASTIAHDASEARQANQDLQRLAAIVESSTDAILTKTVEGTITSWNNAAEALYGYSTEEAVGRHISLIVPPDRLPELRDILAKVAIGSTVDRLETVRVHKDGTTRRVRLSVWPLLDGNGGVAGACALAHDLSVDQARTEAEQRFRTAFARSSFGMLIAALDGVLTAVNPAMCRMLDRTREEVLGHRWPEFLHPDEQDLFDAALGELEMGAESHSSEWRCVRPDGTDLWVEVAVNVVRSDDEEPLYLMAQMQDIGDRKRIEAEMRHRALHDDLTGLPNRALLIDRLDHALAAGRRSGTRTGVLFVDIDGFKNVNDALGHVVGDRLLIEMGRRLQASVRPGDSVARFGGDEFVLVCVDVSDSDVAGLVERVTGVLATPFSIAGAESIIGASIGITLSRPESTSHRLLSEADAAMYRAKAQGRGRASRFDDSLQIRAETMFHGERALRAGMRRGELVAHYQPIVDLRTLKVRGFEALARWQTGDGNLISPVDFIPTAEATGLIVGLGQMILDHAAREVAGWNRDDPTSDPLWVSVNLSARQLDDPTLAGLVTEILAAGGLAPELLHLEITETAVMDDIERSLPVLEELKRSGVHLAIDDFGTGYSSLAYLSQLPVDTLKIDRSFVRNLGISDEDTSIVRSVIGLADAMHLTCVAEGVETALQQGALIGLGCELGQGYLWSPPLEPSQVPGWLRSHRDGLT